MDTPNILTASLRHTAAYPDLHKGIKAVSRSAVQALPYHQTPGTPRRPPVTLAYPRPNSIAAPAAAPRPRPPLAVSTATRPPLPAAARKRRGGSGRGAAAGADARAGGGAAVPGAPRDRPPGIGGHGAPTAGEGAAGRGRAGREGKRDPACVLGLRRPGPSRSAAAVGGCAARSPPRRWQQVLFYFLTDSLL